MNPESEKKEIDELLDAIFSKYGHDFRHYARASLERRIRLFFAKSECSTIPELTDKLLKNESFFRALIMNFSIPVTELFRDPNVYQSLRENVVPLLKTHPFIKIWHAGCATGEEAYSLAILLKEEGLYDRATIFVTDFNDHALEKARSGIYTSEQIKVGTYNYGAAGGHHSFSDYYRAKYNAVAIDSSLRKNMTFANYNLVTDGVFGEMHLILCRNVLIYFDRELQNRVLDLFSNSLILGGFLCLGSKESIRFSTINTAFNDVDRRARIFRKTV